MGRFIPVATLSRLNAVELAILALSALLHDAGMFVADVEKESDLASREYRDFELSMGERGALLGRAREASEHLRAAALQDALLAEYYRRRHPERARDVVEAHLANELTFRNTDFSSAVLRVCESHGWGVQESSDPGHPQNAVARLSTNIPLLGVRVNEQYLACCLRLADIMDFDRSRTPMAVFQHLSFTEPKSWEEWNKHLQVTGWSVTEREVMYVAECTHPAFYVSVMEFLDSIDTELHACRQLVKDAPTGVADRYALHLPQAVDRRHVGMKDKSVLPGAFQFRLDYERIMQLLMDRSLYPDPSLFLRELLQNALDACRTREAHFNAAKQPYQARISVWDHSGDPGNPRIVFQDNGIGMSPRVVENYFMQVGRSYYRSPEFAVERRRLADAGATLEITSQFGIGILSCFMVADAFKVETYHVGATPLEVTIEGPARYFVIRQLTEPARTVVTAPPATDAEDGPPDYAGTRVTVYLRPGTRVDAWRVLDQFAVNVEYETVVYDSSSERRVIAPSRWRDQEPRPAGFGGWLARPGTEPLAPVMDTLLTPARFAIGKYAFSSHLDGQGWFWLLRGADGTPVPAYGHLEMDTALRCSGVAGFAGNLMLLREAGSLRTLGLDYDTFVRTVTKRIDADENPFADFAPLQRSVSDGPDEWTDRTRTWETFSGDERAAVAASLVNGDHWARGWYANRAAAEALARGTLEWAECPVSLNKEYEDFEPYEALALYGIRLPAGVYHWDPFTGSGGRQPHVTGPAGFAADIRRGGPIPAASRLFIDSEAAENVSVPLIRAFIRAGIDISTNSAECSTLEWRRWFGAVVVPLFYHPRWKTELRHAEVDTVKRAMGYLCVEGGSPVVRSHMDLIAKYGRHVPTPRRTFRRDGLDTVDPVNQLLIADCPRGLVPGTVDVGDTLEPMS
jgi:hypothetical protein